MDNLISNDESNQEGAGRAQTTRLRQGKLEDIPKIHAIASAYIGEEAILDDRVIEGWFTANNEVLRVIECDHDPHTREKQWHLCGYYIMLPLTASVAELIKKDAIPHEDIPLSAVQNYSNPAVSSVFFIDFMAHYPICKDRYCGRAAAARLLHDLANTLKDFPERYPHISELIAMPMTRESKILVKRFGFAKDASFQSNPGWELWVIDTPKLAKQAAALITKMANNRRFSN